MFEKIFTANSSMPVAGRSLIAPTNRLHPRKGVIIGLGQVGLACAYSLLIQNCFVDILPSVEPS